MPSYAEEAKEAEKDNNNPEIETEPEFILEDLPSHLRPTSLLIEVFEQLQGVKDNIITYRERDDELLTCIKKL